MLSNVLFSSSSSLFVVTKNDCADTLSSALNWYNKYLEKYIKTTKITVDSQGRPTFYLADGSTFYPSSATTRDWYFYPGNMQKCRKRHLHTDASKYSGPIGICAFAFNFRPIKDTNQLWKFAYNKGFEPFVYSWDGTEEGLFTDSEYGCNKTTTESPAFCVTVIQHNNWKIPKDYPFKVDY